MKRLLIAVAAVITAALSAFAQESDYAKGKPNLLVDYFTTQADIPYQWVEVVRNEVMNALHNSNRVSIIDIDTRGILKLEGDRRNGGAVSGGDLERLALMTQEGADLLLQGVIDGITLTKTKHTDSKGDVTYSYDPVYAFTLKVVNPKDGKLVATKAVKAPDGIFDLSGFSVMAYSPEEAVTAYSKIIPGKLKKFIKEAFPIRGMILEVAEEGKGEVRKVYTNLGSECGAAKGQKYEVREVRTIAGRESRKVIGELEITDVEGDDLSAAKIKSGGKEIYNSMKAENKLILTSKN